ncbi:MAG: NAD(P)-dependent oxidoreductase [bacterium]|nr:NAD(P)-dependent oxidoreductase [bacterium]
MSRARPLVLVAPRGFWNCPEARVILERNDLDAFNGYHPKELILPESQEERERIRVIVLGDQRCGAAEMDQLPNLVLIIRMGTGYDNVDVETAKKRGIKVARMAGVNAEPASELALAHLLALIRRAPEKHHRLSLGDWSTRRPTLRLGIATVGLVGIGHINRALARKLCVLDVGTLIGWNRTPRPEVLQAAADYEIKLCSVVEEVLTQCNAVVVDLALERGPGGTERFLNAERLALLKPGAILINISRGAVVEETLLPDLVRKGAIGGLGLDVFSEEPPGDLTFFHHLSALSRAGYNVLLTPHQGSLAIDTENRSAVRAAQDICKVLRGDLEGVELVA